MEFKNQLEDMLIKIGYVHGEVFEETHSAYYWEILLSDLVFDPVIKKILEKDFDFPEEDEDRLRLTLQETISNSYVRGCRSSKELDVAYKVFFGEKGIVFTVVDDSQGFDHQAKLEKARANHNGLTDERVLDPDKGKEYPGGTGMYCLLHFADEFCYNEKGNALAVRFDLKR